MKKRSLFLSGFFAFLLTLLLGLFFFAFTHQQMLVEGLFNHSSKEYFEGSIHIEKVALDRSLKIHFMGITGKLKTRQGAIPLEIRSMESRDPLHLFLSQKPVRFIFEGMRPQGSPRAGISGTFLFRAHPVSRFEMTANFEHTDLEDLQWLDPQNLGGATGAMKGILTFGQTFGQEPEFSMDLEAPQPGGNIQARFFDLFLPYLPTPLQKEKVQKIAQTQRLIRYDCAALKVSLPQGDRIKIILQIFIPSYNLKLTLNADIRTDEKTTFSKIARIMGHIA